MALSPTRVSREQCSLPPPGDDPPVTPRMGGLPAPPYPLGPLGGLLGGLLGGELRLIYLFAGKAIPEPVSRTW